MVIMQMFPMKGNCIQMGRLYHYLNIGGRGVVEMDKIGDDRWRHE